MCIAEAKTNSLWLENLISKKLRNGANLTEHNLRVLKSMAEIVQLIWNHFEALQIEKSVRQQLISVPLIFHVHLLEKRRPNYVGYPLRHIIIFSLMHMQMYCFILHIHHFDICTYTHCISGSTATKKKKYISFELKDTCHTIRAAIKRSYDMIKTNGLLFFGWNKKMHANNIKYYFSSDFMPSMSSSWVAAMLQQWKWDKRKQRTE